MASCQPCRIETNSRPRSTRQRDAMSSGRQVWKLVSVWIRQAAPHLTLSVDRTTSHCFCDILCLCIRRRNIVQSICLLHVQTMMLEIASDGALVRGTHGAVYYLVRCLEAPPELACTAKNVKLLMCIPGPKALADNGVCWDIILSWFAYLSPGGTADMWTCLALPHLSLCKHQGSGTHRVHQWLHNPIRSDLFWRSWSPSYLR